MYDWLSILRLRLKDVDAKSFVLWRVNTVSNGSWSGLTQHSCFTADNPKPHVAVIFNLSKPLPSQHQHRLEVPRAALLYLLLYVQGEYILKLLYVTLLPVLIRQI